MSVSPQNNILFDNNENESPKSFVFYYGRKWRWAPPRHSIRTTRSLHSKVLLKWLSQRRKERYTYKDRLKGVQILLSNSQAGPGRKVKQEQEEISRNHVQAF